MAKAIQSEGALSFRDLWEVPVDEAISLAEAVSYAVRERGESLGRELEKLNAGRPRRFR